MSPGARRSSRSGSAAPSRPYHHGDLRRALVEAALTLLREQGTEALSLRAVARAAGVSQTAPYRHFQDKRALLAAVAEDGFVRMGAAIGEAVRTGEPGLPALRRGLEAYVTFAVAHAAEYRVMFGPELAQRAGERGLEGAALSAFGLLRGGIERLQGAGQLAAGDPGLLALASWSALHGLVLLFLDGQLEATGHGLPELVEAATGLLLRGMRG